jgi:Putative addiction module component
MALFGFFRAPLVPSGLPEWDGLAFALDDPRVPKSIAARVRADFGEGYPLFYTHRMSQQTKCLAPAVDSTLQTLTPTSAENDRAWLTVARHRLAELRNGEVVAVPGEAVFERLLSREPGYWKARL